MWDGKSYDEFQSEYQFISGQYLIEKLEKYISLSDKCILDLGCGNGMLTHYLSGKTQMNITGVDSDGSMLSVFKDKYFQPNIRIIKSDIPDWLVKQKKGLFNVVFSNATFHWFGSQRAIKSILLSCQKILLKHGVLAVRFSLKENAKEIKDYLRKRLSEYLGEDREVELSQSQIEFNRFRDDLLECGYNILHSEELSFTPFSSSDQDFQFMLKSQPIYKMIGEVAMSDFVEFLQNQWNKEKAKVQSCHAVFIAQI